MNCPILDFRRSAVQVCTVGLFFPFHDKPNVLNGGQAWTLLYYEAVLLKYLQNAVRHHLEKLVTLTFINAKVQ